MLKCSTVAWWSGAPHWEVCPTLGEKFQEWKLVGLMTFGTFKSSACQTEQHLNPVKVDHLHTALHQVNRDTCKVIAFEKERLPYRYFNWYKFHCIDGTQRRLILCLWWDI